MGRGEGISARSLGALGALGALFALGSSALFACSLLTPLDGLAGDAADDAAPPRDGAASDPDSGGRTDAADGGDGAVGSFCASAGGDFCADFDDGGRDVGWTKTDLRGVGTFDLDPNAKSAPWSLRATWPRADVGTDKFQQLEKVWQGAARPTTIDFDLFVAPIAWAGGDLAFTIMELYFDKPEKLGAQILMTPAGWDLAALTPTRSTASSTTPLPVGVWSHLRLETDPASSGGSVRAYLDGTLALEKNGLSFTQNPTEMQLWIGLGAANTPIPAADVRYDNVLVKFR